MSDGNGRSGIGAVCKFGGTSLADGIRVLGINPGPVATERIVGVLKTKAGKRLGDAARYEELLSAYPLGRAAHVREVADLFVYLSSERSAYTSGTIITVDGGITSKRSIG